MAYIQKVTVPPSRVLNFALRDYSGGLNNRSHLLADNEAFALLNMAFVDDVDMEKRNGSTPYDTNVLTQPIQFIHEFMPYTDPNKVVKCDGTNLYMDNVLLTPVAGNISAINFQGKYFFVDGDKYRVYGKFAQATTTYEHIIGTPNPDYVLMQIVNPPTGFTPLDTTYKQGVRVYDYTNLKVWYEPCANEISDAYKNGNVIPEKPRFIVSFNGRIYLSGLDKANDAVYLTDVGNPYYCPATLGLQVPPDSDKVMGLSVYDDSVVVGREHDVYHISGKTNDPTLGLEVFSLKKLNTHTGFANSQSVVNAHNFLFYLGNDGNAYSMSTVNTDTKTLATTLLTKKLDLFAPPFSFTRADIRTATSYFHQDLWYVSIKQYVFVYSYRLQVWTVYNNLNARSFYDLNDILIWGNDAGKLMKFSDDFFDEGKPYKAYWTSKWFDMGDTSFYKQYREFFITAHTFDNFNSDIRMTFEIDYADVKASSIITNQMSVWGKSVFGDRFINRNINTSLPFVIGQRGRQLRFTFTNGYFITGDVASVDDLVNVPDKVDGETLYTLNGIDLYLYKDHMWNLLTSKDVNQPMRVYQINGDYEIKGKR